jgi:hypothetical protein
MAIFSITVQRTLKILLQVTGGGSKELGAFVKEYVNSEDFKSQYAQLREQKKPGAPELPHSAEEISRLRTGRDPEVDCLH